MLSWEIDADSLSIRELMDRDAWRRIVFEEAPDMRQIVAVEGIPPQLGNFTLRSLTRDTVNYTLPVWS